MPRLKFDFGSQRLRLVDISNSHNRSDDPKNIIVRIRLCRLAQVLAMSGVFSMREDHMTVVGSNERRRQSRFMDWRLTHFKEVLRLRAWNSALAQEKLLETG